jgi:predicted DNA-binding antitoxin AbrB/MazE fold protein
MVIRAKYERGVFKPLEKIELQEGTVLEIALPSSDEETRRSVRDLAFVGMWKDRTDIADGLTYVSRLRDNPRT